MTHTPLRPDATQQRHLALRPSDCWQWSEDQIRDWQLKQLNGQLAAILPSNKFYQQKFGSDFLQLSSLDDLSNLPMTSKQELVASAAEAKDGISSHHSYPSQEYSRLHRTSGTTGKPLPILDTELDWRCWSSTWQHVLEAAEIGVEDRVFLAFSFGPFIGFWSAHQACVDRGAMVIPGGGLSTLARLEFMRSSKATLLCCTPSYALHMAEVAERENFDIAALPVKRLIVAGESGGSVPEVRSRMESLWQAKVVDHSGATEIGPWGFGWPARPGLHVIETSFIAELLPVETDHTALADSSSAAFRELVITSLCRYGAPVIRYRTGDVVIAERPTSGPCRFLWMPQGVVGRSDNMVTVRGVNVFPSSIDAVVREFNSIAEYQVQVTRSAALDQLAISIEADESTQLELEKRLQMRLGLRITVSLAAPDSLPRSELKSRRWHDLRN
ncbi:MAG: phenylacetate--CoA ligase family protein [Planctomycetota bacterium]|nr:phenylacetate--CoA ligase family protein [Planctomycetota bacterium]